MPSSPDSALHPSRTSLRALEASNFFLADVQTGLGPFLAAYLVASHWTPSAALYALTVGGLTGRAAPDALTSPPARWQLQ
jgi:hypothetical protein